MFSPVWVQLKCLPFASQERDPLLPSLLVLCGDHGMSEAGGHGASSMEEVSTALVLVSSAFERKPGEIWVFNSFKPVLYFFVFYTLILILKTIFRSCISLKNPE